MIGTIRRHQTWLWVVLIAIMSVSLVYTFGPSQRLNNGSRAGASNLGYLAGKPITQSEFVEARKEVILGYYLQNRQWPPEDASAELVRLAYQRLFLINKEHELGIHIGTEAIGEAARHMLGGGSLESFSDQVLKQGGLTLQDFEGFLRHELGLEQLVKLAGLSGNLVTPQEADTLYRLEHQDVDASIVLFTASNYLSSVSATPGEISKFYSNQLANYRVPEQVQVQYVKFPLANYTNAAMASLTNLDKIVDSTVESLGTNLYQHATTPAESREAIRKEVIHRQTIYEARKVALAFAKQLDALPHDLQTFNQLAASNHLTVGTTAPFDREFGPSPAEMMVSPDFTRRAFQLTKEDPFSGAITPDPDHPSDGVYVIALKDRTPSRVPDFKEVEAKVSADYRYAMATQIAQKEAVQFDNRATNELAQGKSWQTVCNRAGVEPQSLPPFNLNTRSLPGALDQTVRFDILRQVAFGTPVGKVSPAAPARGGAFVLYLNRMLPADEAKMKQEFTSYLTMLRQGRQDDSFNQWFNVQLNRDPEFLQRLKDVTEQAQAHTGNNRRPRS